MGHGISWFSFWSLFQDAQTFADSHSGYPMCVGEACPVFGWKGLLFGNPATMQPVFAAVLVVIVLSLVALRARMQLNKLGDQGLVPSPNVTIHNFLEVVLEALYRQMESIIGPEAKRYFPIIGTLALFIFFSNVLGLVPGFLPPTDNWNTTMSCGGLIFVYYNYHGLRTQGLGHLAHMANPAGTTLGWFLAPLLFPIELVSHVARPFTLGIRLAANMVGDHAVLFAFLGLVPILVPLPFLALGLLVCAIQTLVFVLLSIIYIGLAVQVAHHDDEEHGAEAHAHAH